jgi:formate-dependent nitrite reductase membrane component NrfD
VIYGLLVTEGLQCVVKSSSDLQDWVTNALLFLGTFLLSLHFWYVCATVDQLSRDFYRVFSRGHGPYFDLLLLYDASMATCFAGLVLAMFYAIPPRGSRFFLAFLCAAGLSFLYDVGSRVLVFFARRIREEENQRDTIHRYNEKVTNWIKGDVVFSIASLAMYYSYRMFFVHASSADKYNLPHTFALAGAFAALSVLLLLWDVELLTFPKHPH